MQPKKIYRTLFPGLSYEHEPLMDAIWLSCGVIGLLSLTIILFGGM